MRKPSIQMIHKLKNTINFFWQVIVVALLLLQLTTVAQAVQTQSLHGHVPDAVAHLTPMERLPATNVLHLVISLPLRNREDLTNLLQQLYDPASPNYHHYLTTEQFAERFGPSAEDYQSISNFARANGLTVTGTHPNRTLLDVSGTVADVERAFHVSLQVYQHPKESRTFFAPTLEPSLSLAASVLHVGGLDSYWVPRPVSLMPKALDTGDGWSNGRNPNQLSGSGPSGTYMGYDFRSAYVPGSTLTGTGQILGLLECDGYFTNDITAYESQAGLPNITLTNVAIDGGVTTPGSGLIEVSLDIEMAIAMAPGLSSVMVYEAPTDPVTDGSPPFIYDMLNRMATDNLAKQISSSWVFRNDASIDQAFMQFAAQGQSYFQASGDQDAYTAATFQWDDDPYITLVGGTTLTTSGPGGAWASETVWNWDVEYGQTYDGVGSTGGISTNIPIPIWQQGIDMTANGGSTTFRNFPDVALTADNIFVYANAASNAVGGTSCAAPLWAGFMALVNQQAMSTGSQTAGFINPAIYAIGNGSGYASTFHDITTGNNTWSGSPSAYYAVSGYDLCTGWGTPAGTNLINILAPLDDLRIYPGIGFASVGGVGGPFTVSSAILTLTNAGTNSLTWSLTNSSAWLDATPVGGTLTPGGPATKVTVSLNGTASNLALGSYSAVVAFTNLNDGYGQNCLFTLNVIAPPIITSNPSSQALLQGATALFAVGATGAAPLSYQWQQNGTNLIDEANISGSATTALVISNVSVADVASYDVVVSNPAGSVTSAPPANLTITPSQPVITSQPVSQTAVTGGTAQFTVAALGNMPFSYQWYFENAIVTNATNAILSLTGLNTNQSGAYYVTVSNSLGVTPSSNATLTVQTGTLELVTFDDLATNEEPGLKVPAGYNGVTWSNFYEFDAITSVGVPSGATAGLISAPNVAYNLNGTPAAITAPLPFDLVSAYLTAAWRDNLQVELKGYSGATLSYDNTYTLSATNPTFINFNYLNVTALEFISFGGTPHPGYVGNGEHFIMDNLSVLLPSNPPIISFQPSDQTAEVGFAARFSLTALSFMPLSYSWSQNGVAIPGATNSSYTISDAQLADSGSQFSCVVSNAYGSVASSNAVLTVTSPSLVLNGGFELGNFTDWTPGGNFEDCLVNPGSYLHSGLYGAELGPGGSLGYLSQTIATSSGQPYLISCWLLSDGDTPNEFLVSWNGATLFDGVNLPAGAWTNLQFIAPATGASTVLKFGFRDDLGYLGLDDITVSATARPSLTAGQANGSFVATWFAVAGGTYQAQYKTNVTQTNWINFGPPIVGSNSTVAIGNLIGGDTQRFYRLIVLP